MKRKHTRTLIELLDKLKTGFDSKSSSTKLTILNVLAGREIIDANLLESYHDILCFLRAYPDNPGMLKAVESEFNRFHERIEKYKTESGDRRAKWLQDTGIVNTELSHTFSYELTVALSEWYRENIEIDWKLYDKSDTDTISAFMPLIVAWQENDTLDNDLTIDTRDWLKLAKSKKDSTELSILLKLLQTCGLSRAVQRHLYENAEISTLWKLPNCPASRTLKRIPFKRKYYQKQPIIGRTKNLRERLREPAPKLKRLSIKEGKEYVRHIREVLGIRCRELYPLIHSNPREIYIFEPGRGLQLVVLGNDQDIRLPLESNFGAMLVRNGMPIGYGIGCMLFERVEIAINIFPAYRTGESSFIIEEFFRLFYHHFGARLLLVRSYQVGDDDNTEALESGSFWFYYKLGFRSVNNRVRVLADREYEKIKTRKKYRSSMRTLRRLSKGDVFFHIDPAKMDGYRELPLKNLGYLVTEYIRDKYYGERQLAIDKSVSYLARVLGVKGWRRWTDNEISSFERLAPLFAAIPGLTKWTKKEKPDLARIIRAKGSNCERDFVRLCNNHHKFKDTIEQLAFERENNGSR